MNEIVNCPFCNSQALLHDSFPDRFWVQCKDCHARGPWNMDRDRAVHAWNLSLEPASLLVALSTAAENNPVLTSFLKERRTKTTWKMICEYVTRING
jgi:hypothetical protein